MIEFKSNTILIDIDGTLTRNEEWIITACKNRYNKDILKTDIEYNGIKSNLNINMVDLLDEEYYREVEPMPYAKEVISRLIPNYNLIYVTARASYATNIGNIRELTYIWLKEHIYPTGFHGDIPILFMGDNRSDMVKHQNVIFIVEDGVNSIIELLKNGYENKIIQILKHYNKNVEKYTKVSPYAVCRDWNCVYEVIQRRK
jgi:5'(3')-deoxyribonucleotidase